MVLTPDEAWEALAADIRADLGNIDDEDADALIAGLIRRAASVRSPCARTDLVDALAESLDGMIPPDVGSRSNLDRVLEQLLAAGDLIELERDRGRSIVYLSPPRFVPRKNSLLVMGGYADSGLPLSPELKASLSSRHAHRFLRVEAMDEAKAALRAQGFFPYPMDAWTAAPGAIDAGELLDGLKERLRQAGRAGDVPELVVLDQTDSNQYYRSRWVPTHGQSGRYVGRRPQKWGAPLWCYVDLDDGTPVRLIDLPVVDRRFPACDEAWWIQFAIDAIQERPQEIRVDKAASGSSTISLRMPLPSWAARRLLLVGDLLPRASGGYLFTYAIWEGELEEETSFLQEYLWCQLKR